MANQRCCCCFFFFICNANCGSWELLDSFMFLPVAIVLHLYNGVVVRPLPCLYVCVCVCVWGVIYVGVQIPDKLSASLAAVCET